MIEIKESSIFSFLKNTNKHTSLTHAFSLKTPDVVIWISFWTTDGVLFFIYLFFLFFTFNLKCFSAWITN